MGERCSNLGGPRAMGYRELLKSYIRHLELVTGDNYIEQEGNEPVLGKRDLGELRTLAAEIRRDAYRAAELRRPSSPASNQR